MNQEIFGGDLDTMPASMNNPHLACVLLLDTSTSMQNGNAIDALNTAVKDFREQCIAKDELCRGLDLAVVSFASEVKVLQEFAPITKMEVPILTANGQTHMGEGLNKAIDLIERRKQQYKELGVPYYRPWIFMISDGAPNDDYMEAFKRVVQMQQSKKMELWAVGVPGYEKEILTAITKRVIELDASLNFAGLFEWLSTSLSAKSQSEPGASVQYDILPEGSRVVPSDWGN